MPRALALALLAAGLSAGPARGDLVLTLDGATPGDHLGSGGTVITESGYRIAYSGGNDAEVYSYNGKNVLRDSYFDNFDFSSAQVKITRLDGRNFDFLGLDVANLAPASFQVSDISVFAYDDPGQPEFRTTPTSSTLTSVSVTPDFENVSSVYVNILRTSFSQDYYVVTNFRVREVAAPVPEPGVMAMGLLATGSAAGLVRRFRRRAEATT